MVEAQSHPASGRRYSPEYCDTYPLGDFRNDPRHFFDLLRTECSHLTLTLDGKAEAVILTPTEYQRLRDLAADADTTEAIRQGTEDFEAGRFQSAEEFLTEFRAAHDLPR